MLLLQWMLGASVGFASPRLSSKRCSESRQHLIHALQDVSVLPCTHSGAVLMSDRKRAAVIGHDVSMYCKVRRGLHACMRGGCKRCLTAAHLAAIELKKSATQGRCIMFAWLPNTHDVYSIG